VSPSVDHDLGECPTCRMSCPVFMPAEPEVGIFTVLYECKEHGPFYFEGGEAHFPDCFKRTPPESPDSSPTGTGKP